MYKLVTVAVLALIGTSEAHKIYKHSGLSSQEKEDNFMMCNNEEADFEDGLSGFYENSSVKVIDGDDVKSTLLHHGNLGDKPMLVVSFHPQCGHCKTMKDDYIKLANEANTEGKVVVAATNMSLSSEFEDKLNLDGYPTVRYYTKAGHFEKFHDSKGRNFDGFKHFLQRKGFLKA